ncbi:hypothetical protein ACFLY4_04840 [Chloroflexota bacterium]
MNRVTRQSVQWDITRDSVQIAIPLPFGPQQISNMTQNIQVIVNPAITETNPLRITKGNVRNATTRAAGHSPIEQDLIVNHAIPDPQIITPDSAVTATSLPRGRIQISITMRLSIANHAIIDQQTITPDSAANAITHPLGKMQISITAG